MPRAVREVELPAGASRRDAGRPAPGAAGTALAELAQRIRPQVLATEEHLPLAPGLQAALGLSGLRRGGLIACLSDPGGGATSLALGLLAAATTAGNWAAVVGIADLGALAASELGVALDRVVLAPDPGRRAGAALAAFVEGCDLVLVGGPLSLSRKEKVALLARARQRRVVLVILERSAAGRGSWPEVPDVAIEVAAATFVGLERGVGRIVARRLEVVTRQRRGGMLPTSGSLWLPAPPVDLDPAALLPEEPSAAQRDEPQTLPLALP